jgi:phage tail P2-like protein
VSVYRLLPDYMRGADTGVLAAYLEAASTGLAGATDLLTLVDPDTSVTGGNELIDADAVPRAFLPWLGWLVGVDTTSIPDADMRQAVRQASVRQRRGSTGSIADAVQRTLTGAKSVRVYINLSGTDPYLITVVTTDTQTPDEAASLVAAMSEKPAGADLELQVVSGVAYDEIKAAFADYDDVQAAFDDYTALLNFVPPTP